MTTEQFLGMDVSPLEVKRMQLAQQQDAALFVRLAAIQVAQRLRDSKSTPPATGVRTVTNHGSKIGHTEKVPVWLFTQRIYRADDGSTIAGGEALTTKGEVLSYTQTVDSPLQLHGETSNNDLVPYEEILTDVSAADQPAAQRIVSQIQALITN